MPAAGDLYQITPRAPVPIPASLRDTLKILLEEELYLPGIDLLSNLLAQGFGRSSNSTNNETIYVPPPIYISLLTTLLAHPHFTTHIPRTGRVDRDFPLLPAHAERVLRRYLALAGARGAGIIDAWQFKEVSRRRGMRGGSISAGVMGESSEAFEDDKLDLRFAQKESIFDRGDDFWAVMGWGFTCACAKGKGEREKWMRRRWEGAWRRLIGVAVEGLERDWAERGKVENMLGGPEIAGDEGREGALVLKYLPGTTGSVGVRRVARAIFANGRGRMSGEWKEVWAWEAAAPSSAKRKTTGGKVLNKKGKKGSKKGNEGDDKTVRERLGVFDESEDDYFSDASDTAGIETRDSSEEDTISVGITPQPSALPPNAADAWGGLDAIELRQKIIMLLLDVCNNGYYLPSEILHEAFTDHILPLSLWELPLFTTSSSLCTDGQAFIPTTSHQKNLAHLIKHLLDALMESEAPMPSEESEELDMKELVICYLPYGAKSGKVVDNLKVGFLIEKLMRGLLKSGGTDGVERDWAVEALEKGIESRKKNGGKILGGKKEDEMMARKWLEEGEQRLHMLVEEGW
ncbi:hypothetical protein BGX38DRAFT_1222220 [Terfezia claveryi]|nr:hypothetical protein BGX38DRAFT_1222220 [Terfezia claveryi]